MPLVLLKTQDGCTLQDKMIQNNLYVWNDKWIKGKLWIITFIKYYLSISSLVYNWYQHYLNFGSEVSIDKALIKSQVIPASSLTCSLSLHCLYFSWGLRSSGQILDVVPVICWNHSPSLSVTVTWLTGYLFTSRA